MPARDVSADRSRPGVSRRLASLLVGAGAAACARLARASVPGRGRFIVYYGREADEALREAAVAVLEPEASPDLIATRGAGATFLGYVSLGEVHDARPYFRDLEQAGVLLGEQPNWPGAWFVDMRSEVWRRLLLERVVPEVMARGFDGIFIDTLDDAGFLESRDPVRCAGMVTAAARLVRALRQRIPGRPIMINRGYAVLPQIVGQFDMLLGESVRSTHRPGDGSYALLSNSDYAWQRDQMWEARRRHPALRLFSLDYWDPSDETGIARLYAEQRRNGFVPYVATPDLTRIVPAPTDAQP